MQALVVIVVQCFVYPCNNENSCNLSLHNMHDILCFSRSPACEYYGVIVLT